MTGDRLAVVPLDESDAPPPPDDPRSPDVRGLVAPDAESPLRLSATPRVCTPPATITVALVNEADRPFATNHHDWSLWKRTPDGWAFVCPDAANDPLYRLSPGDRHEWTLRIDAGGPGAGEWLPDSSGARHLSVGGLGGGAYGFVATGALGRWPQDAAALSVRVRVEGPSVALTPGHAVAERRRTDDELTVHVADTTGEYERRAVYVVERLGDGAESADGIRLVTERVIRDPPLRTALWALSDDSTARVVRVVAPTTAYPPFELDDPVFVRYEGTRYRLSSSDAADGPGR
jgi:hypothetical protein